MNMMRGNEIGGVGWEGGVVPPLQGGGGCCWGSPTRACSPVYHIAPLQGVRMAGARMRVVRT